MPRVEHVVPRLLGVGEAAHAARPPQLLEALHAAREELVGVALVRHVEDDAVALEVVDAVQGRGQLHDPEVGAQVAAGPLHALQQEGAHLVAQGGQLLAREGMHVGGPPDPLEERVARSCLGLGVSGLGHGSPGAPQRSPREPCGSCVIIPQPSGGGNHPGASI